MTWATGDLIWVKHGNREVEGRVMLASPNSVSLFIEFEAMFDGHLGQMPVLLEPDDVYRSIVNGAEVFLRRRDG